MTLTVPEESSGQRLDVFLVSVLADHSRSQIQRLIREEGVRVDGQGGKPNQPVKTGQTIAVVVPDPVDAAPKAEPLDLPILYQDNDLIVVDKPAGMVVHPAAGHTTGTLVNALLHHVTDLSGIGGEKRPGIVHRLDRGTSGLMVVAKNDAAHEELARQFHDREVEKEYIGLVWGEVQAGRRIDDPIGLWLDQAGGGHVENRPLDPGGHVDYWREAKVAGALEELIGPIASVGAAHDGSRTADGRARI